MKKIYLLLTMFLVIFLVSCTDSCYNYNVDTVDDLLEIGYNEKNNEGFIGNIYWNFDLNNMDIVIPDTYKDCKITKFGGYSGTGNPGSFDIYVKYDEYYPTYEDIPENSLIINLTITIKLNKYLHGFGDNIRYNEYGYYLHDNNYYKLNKKFIDNQKNETFYVEEGKLYYKETNELVSEFDGFY